MTDLHFMRIALREAAKGFGTTTPNPAVGALLVHHDKIISRAHHRQSGAAHAEVECLNQVPASLRARSTLYVTLEPCCTVGRTGACTRKIIEAGIKTVVVGAIDPNPRHHGRGITELRNAGVAVRVGVLEKECTALNEAFNKWIVTRRPFVITKCGMSLDGRLTRPPGEPRWITGASARNHARILRGSVDAIIVGAETVRTDNPRLTLRGTGQMQQPWRVILTKSGKLPPTSRVLTDRFRDRTIIYRGKSLESVLVDLGRKNITSVLIEGGGNILSQALDSRLIDKVQIYLGPILTGGPVVAFAGKGAGTTADALHLERLNFSKIDNNICVTGYPSKRLPE